MKNINRQLYITNVEAYKLFEIELPKIAKANKNYLLNMTSDTGDLEYHFRRYMNFLHDHCSRRQLNLLGKKLVNGEGINIDIEGENFNHSNLYLKQSAYDNVISDDVINVSFNAAIGHVAKLKYKILSSSLYDSIQNIAYDLSPIDNGNLFRSLTKHLKYKEFEKGTDRNFTIKKDGTMTYLPSNKESVTTDNDTWEKTGRQEIKYGKGIRKIFSSVYDITEKDVETLSNKLSEKFKFCGEFIVVTGTDITKYYHGNTYANNAGSLNSSCMRGSCCQTFFGLYEQNAKMLIALNRDRKVMGRALLWDEVHTDNYDEPIKLMDRIYGNDITIEAFKTWAYNNNYFHKAHQNYSDADLVIMPNSSKSKEKMEMWIDVKGPYEAYPYMDTFKSTDDDLCDSTHIRIYNNKDYDYVLESTNGYLDDEDYVVLENGTREHVDYACHVERYDEWHHTDDCVYTEDCVYELMDDAIEVDDRWYSRDSDDIVYSEYENEYILVDESKLIGGIYYPQDADCIRYSEYLGESVHEDDVVYSEAEQDYLPLDKVVECFISNDWILKENAIEVNISDKLYYANSETYTQGELITKIQES
ncbi:MAG TPA: hypothetical protein DCY51_06875 [Bacteroidetes bacterium]|nr:hypothetical protein [Bacteroidota bacterium]